MNPLPSTQFRARSRSLRKIRSASPGSRSPAPATDAPASRDRTSGNVLRRTHRSPPDSLCLREFLRIGLDEPTADHVTISRTRRLLDEATQQEIFGWVSRQVTRAGLLKGKTIGIDATTLEANAAMKSIVRRGTEERYNEYLKRLAEAAGEEADEEAALRR